MRDPLGRGVAIRKSPASDCRLGVHSSMEHVAPNEFVARISRGWDPRMNTAIYDGLDFQCACGDSHSFDTATTSPLLELPGMRLVIKCPTSHSLTCIKIRGFLQYRIESLFGALMPNPEDPLSVGKSLPAIGDRGLPPNSGFTPALSDEIRSSHTGLPFRIISGAFAGSDGQSYWLTIVLGLAQAEPAATLTVAPKLSFVRRDRASAETTHRTVLEVIANEDPESWAERLPALAPDSGYDDDIRNMLRDFAARLHSSLPDMPAA